ncbi:tigger transposable element-derived protein 4-like [Haliotis asinina]|uniref:tigger transposable element-derived protein 4-like n=1 Tax=Haliotis asinina TaxID=109174 RepID=UPI003531A393
MEGLSWKRKALDLDTKYQIIQAVDAGGKSKTVIAAEFKIPKSTLSTILKDKEAIISKLQSAEYGSSRKRIRVSNFEDVEKALFEWFKSVRSENIPLSGPILLAKADEFSVKHGHTDFKAYQSWLERFKKRRGICSAMTHIESSSVDSKSVDDWLTSQLPMLLKNYSPENLFNADESGLFYKLVPQRTLHLKGDKCHGGKKSKEHITVLTAANISGTEKLKLFVIGKSEKPRCFKNVRSLPVDYRSNGKAWMTSDLFTLTSEWVNKLDQSMRRQNRKVLLLIDNCPAHPRVPNLKNVTVAYLPPNTTSKIQPMDQGIIASLKSNYRKQMMTDLICAYDKKEKYDVTLLSAITNIHQAWCHVTSQCIVNCFRKGGFKLPDENDKDDSELDEDDIPLANVRGMWGEVTLLMYRQR